MIVYKIINTVNAKIYVGITTKTLAQRWSMHLNNASKKIAGRALYAAMKKYGIERFKIMEIGRADSIGDLKKFEQQQIAALGSMAPGGYNLTAGGDGITGYRHTEEQCRRHAERHKGFRHSPEAIERIRAGNLGKKMAPEAVESARLKRIGVKRTDEQKERIRAGRRAGKKPRPNKGNSKYEPSRILDAMARVRAGERQSHVARDIGIHQSYLSQLLAGKRGFSLHRGVE